MQAPEPQRWALGLSYSGQGCGTWGREVRIDAFRIVGFGQRAGRPLGQGWHGKGLDVQVESCRYRYRGLA